MKIKVRITARNTVMMYLAGLAALLSAGCRGHNILSTRDEVHIGREVSADVEHTYRVDNTSEDAKRVRRIGERLLVHTDGRPGVPYSFRVLDAKDVNAVSLPGGPIFVFRGLLDLVGDDDDELATVIGHEIGHVNARHAAKQISQQLEANLAIGLLVKGRTASQLAGLGADLIGMKFSREDEYEADRRGLSYAYKAGFDPRGMIRFFEKLSALDKRAGGTPEFLRTHPVTKARIDKAQKLIEAQEYKFGQ